MEEKKIRVAITHGDTNSTNYKDLFEVLAEPSILELFTPIIYGSPKIAAYHRKALDIQANFAIISKSEDSKDGRVNLLTSFDDEVKVELGQPTSESSEAALKALDRALDDYAAGGFDVLVTSPVCESTINANAHHFTNHASYIMSKIGTEVAILPMLICENLRVGLVTTRMDLADVSNRLTKDLIKEKAKILFDSMKRDFRISNPRIAVLEPSPSGIVEENDANSTNGMAKAAVDELENEGVRAFGPYAADEFFGNGEFSSFDGVLAMYYDQGAIPFKLIADDEAVCYTAGLPFVHTAPAHAVRFDMDDSNQSDENQLRQAMYLAIDIYRNRAEYDTPLENTLPKLYREKRDDSDKVRFAVPKKKEAKE